MTATLVGEPREVASIIGDGSIQIKYQSEVMAMLNDRRIKVHKDFDLKPFFAPSLDRAVLSPAASGSMNAGLCC